VAIQEALEDLERCTDEYLQLARSSKMEFGLHDVGLLLENQLRMLNDEIQNRDVDLKTEIDQDIPPVLLDEEQFGRALERILVSSLESMPNGGELTIKISRDKNDVVILISDTGIKIGKGEWNCVRRRSDVLSLPLAEQIIRQHGGYMLSTGAIGEETSFTIRLPISRGR
jgi:signal transduction histidine kinase